MVGFTEDYTMGGKREPPTHPYEVISEHALKAYDLKKAARIDIPCEDPMKLGQIADELEALAHALRRVRISVGTVPAHMSLLAAVGEIRLANQKVRRITKSGGSP
jgi:hypothetical protein